MSVSVKMKGGGRFTNCVYTPLKIDFKKEEIIGTVLENADEINLVTHCQFGWNVEYDPVENVLKPPLADKFSQEFVVREWFAYKVSELLNLVHQKTRLANVELTDADPKGIPSVTHSMFFQERPTKMAKRYGLTKEDLQEADSPWEEPQTYRKIAPLEFALFSFTQNFIGNEDWSYFDYGVFHNGLKNTGSLKFSSEMQAIYSYDYDMSALVSGEIPKKEVAFFPDESGDTSNILRDLVSDGIRHSERAYGEAAKIVLEKEPKMRDLLLSLKGKISEKSHKKIEARLEGFLKAIKLLDTAKVLVTSSVKLFSLENPKKVLCETGRGNPVFVSKELAGGIEVGLINRRGLGDNEVCMNEEGEYFLKGFVAKEDVINSFPSKSVLFDRDCALAEKTKSCFNGGGGISCWKRCSPEL